VLKQITVILNTRTLRALLLSLVSSILFILLHPRIGIIDIDAIYYVEGAYSIANRGEYRWLFDQPLNIFPPAFSLLLSFFPDPIQAAYYINALSMGVAMSALYILARRADWDEISALGLSLALGFGFFRSMAGFAKPDILGYALFLLAMLAYSHDNRRWHFASYFLLSLLFPLKHIALLFTPAAFAATWFIKQKRLSLNFVAYALIIASWVLSVGGLILFNYATIGLPTSSSHPENIDFIAKVIEFLSSFPRTFLSYWYGSVDEPIGFIAFVVMLIASLIAVATLRPNFEYPQLPLFGLIFLFFSVLLLLVRGFSSTPRVLGYGYLLLFFAFRPLPKWKSTWLIYGMIAIGVAIVNLLTVNFGGLNHPEYERLTQEIVQMPLPENEIIYTNSEDILDIHVRIGTRLATDVNAIPDNGYFLWITFPDYDPIMRPVMPMERPVNLCLIGETDHAALFQHCNS
jgi:hypothetical protein